jgi:ribosomal protein S18 acetylase RimI-like enzyme
MGRAKQEQGSTIRVRPARATDLTTIARIGSGSFSGLQPLAVGRRWVRACWAGRPRMRYWTATQRGRVVAYILWIEKGGFRSEAVLELEQIAVVPNLRGQGIGGVLVHESFQQLTLELTASGRRVKLVEVTTGSEQGAIDFYRRVLGAELVATIPDLFRGDEYLLIARPTFPMRR